MKLRTAIRRTCAAGLFLRHSHANLFGDQAVSLSNVLQSLDASKSAIDEKLFLYQTPAFQWVPSSVYRYADFRESLRVMAADGVAGKTFYVGESGVENGHVYGLVNIAAFLAQSMKETIQYDACDENSWDLVGGKYPLSNACGQLGQSYQDYHCSPEEAHMECPVDPDMAITSVTHAKWYGAPAPMFCGPKTTEEPFTGFWDYNYECNKGWANPPESCDVYEGQKAGRFDTSTPYANTAGRTDVEGCCWWGRGVIQTSGVCNFGKLNYYLGAGAKKDGRAAKYPEVDFCKDPEVICASSEYKELKWIAGEFYWMESVQSYNKGGWDYTTELRKFVEGGMTGTSFIDSVSGIVNRGCHNPPCGTGPLDGGIERAQNFRKVLDAFFGGSPPPKVGLPSGSQAGSASSTGSVALGRWYPDYNGQFSLGKCTNEAPLPNGRPSYETGIECCQKAYANQASGVCVSSLVPQAPPTPSGPPPGQSPTGSASSTGSVASGRWYPDYNGQFSLGKCTNEAPIPNGRPSYETGIECCQKAYANQASGVCVSFLPQAPSTPSGPPPGQSPQSPTSTRLPVSPFSEAGIIITSDNFVQMENTLESVKDEIDNKLFLYETPSFQWVPSTVYRYEDFKESLYVMATDGVAGKTFYIGESGVKNGHVYGLVNIAAFLAQSMKETIQYDACDENSWDLVGGKYPLSNACGQLGQSYQDYHCSPEEAHMECPVDPDMAITGVTHAKWYGAPAPMFCGPKTAEEPFSGFWDYNYECNKGWANPPESCDVYEGQKAGRFDTSRPYANTAGRTDVEGCCWWGRGVIQTSGVCNFGKLNYYLGAGAKKGGRAAKYPEVDFCKDPEVICASSEYKELKWIAGEFYWMESVQSYNEGGWDYTTELRKFVEGGMTGTSFIDSVSGIVNRGCHNPPCGTGPVDGAWERAQNFRKVLDAFFGGSPPPKVGLPSVPQTGSGSSTGSVASDRWYPDYNSQFSLGKCTNEAPLPSGRPSYETGIECCQKAYANQASGICVSFLPQAPSTPSGTPPGQSPQPLPTSNDMGTSSSISSHAHNNYITYKCDSYADFPIDSLVIDILFDYEVSFSHTSQPQHLLPDLKKQIMDDLAHTLGCQTSVQRNLRRISEDQVLLGFRSVEGGDVIDGEKGSCSKSEADLSPQNSLCVPVTGHLAAFVKRNTSLPTVIATKDIILNGIQDDMAASNGYSNLTQRIVYVSEHGSEVQHHPNNGDRVGESSNTGYVIVILVLALMFAATTGLLVKRKRGIDQNKEERGVSWCEHLAAKVAPDVNSSCDKRIDDDISSISSSQERNQKDEHEDSIIDHAEFLKGEFASAGVSSSDDSEFSDNSSTVSEGC